MKVSVIIPTYKDDIALKLILDALQYQTYSNFEILIAEDCEEDSTKNLIKKYRSKYPIWHYFHENKGNRKPKAVNNCIKKSSGEYIIFIDGDTIPFSTFIEHHVLLSNPQIGLCGRRVNLGDKVSDDLRKNIINAYTIEKNYIKNYKYLNNDNIRHYEQGLCFKPKSLINKLLSVFDKNTNIVASNFSCFKNDLIEVNGIDFSLPYAPSRDDTDLQWRLEAIGVKMKSAKYCANLFHLNHPRTDRKEEDIANREIIEEKKKSKQIRAKIGIIEC
jgi:glycosyltransferase involved in cell wall biosynthesis